MLVIQKCPLPSAVLLDEDKDELLEHQTSPLRSAFRTFDATDYKPISRSRVPLSVLQREVLSAHATLSSPPAATVDVRRDIGHLCADGRDCYLGVIEVPPSNKLRTSHCGA